MKKFIAPFLALCMVVCFATVSMAANQVEVKSNSEGITASEDACEKFGSLTFIFDSGTVLLDGDWWYADLPSGVTLCQSFDFAILGTAGMPVPAGGGGFATYVHDGDDGTSDSYGFWTVKDTIAGDTMFGTITAAGTSPVWFRVSGSTGGQRVLMQVFDGDDNDYTNALCSDGSSSLTVEAGTSFQIKLFDGEFYDTGKWGYNDTLGNGQFGEDGDDDLLGVDNDWDNSYCGDAYGYGSNTINVSINSGGESGNNFLTFDPTNPEVAHTISASVIELDDCKGPEYGYVNLAGGQSAKCEFNYETPTEYCDDIGTTVADAFVDSIVSGNKIFIRNTSGTFFNSGDEYKIVLRTSGSGAYWMGATPVVSGYEPSANDECDADAAGTATNLGLAAFTITTETGVTAGSGATGTGCGSIAADDRYMILTSAAFTDIDDYDLLEINIPGVVFDPAQFAEGDQVTVTVELYRLPCGLIFSDDRVIAEFVDACATAAATTTLLFPYSTPLNDASWWFGMSFCNPTLTGAVAGTALITVYEDDGDTGTYTTPSIAVGGMATYGGAELLSNLTAASANTGTLGDSRCHIIVNCNFGSAGGFGMMGDGSDSTGYAAYGNSAAWAY